MPFVAKFDNGGSLIRRIFEVIHDKTRVTDGLFVVNADGLTMQTMDSAHVAMCDLAIGKQVAKSWKCDDTYHIGVSLETFLKVLKVAPGNSTCTLKFDPTNADALHVSYHVGDSKKARSSFKVKLIPFDNEERYEIPDDQIPDQKHVVDSGELSRTLKNLADFSEDVDMTLQPSGFHFECTGDNADAEMEMNVLSTTVTDSIKERFSLEYMQWVTKAGSVFGSLTVGYKMPALVLEFTDDHMILRFFLAAKVA